MCKTIKQSYSKAFQGFTISAEGNNENFKTLYLIYTIYKVNYRMNENGIIEIQQ